MTSDLDLDFLASQRRIRRLVLLSVIAFSLAPIGVAFLVGNSVAIVATLDEKTRENQLELQALQAAGEAARETAENAAKLAKENEVTAKMATNQAEQLLARIQEASALAKERDKAAQRAEQAQTKQQLAHAADLRNVVATLSKSLSDMSQGDYSTRIVVNLPGDYAILREDFKAAMDNLEIAFQAVLQDASDIMHDTTEISSSSDLLAARTEQQADTLANVTESTKRLKSMVETSAHYACEVRQSVEETRETAHRNSDIVASAVAAMTKIEDSSRQIQKITDVIDEISFQTNLLALNAGRGFAVVASEVRSLAHRSSEAANEINALITRSGAQIQEGVGLVNQTGNSIAEMQNAIQQVSNMVSQIENASRSQAKDLADVTDAISQLDQYTQQNAAMFEETTAATKLLNTRTENLALRIKQFVPDEQNSKDHFSTRRAS